MLSMEEVGVPLKNIHSLLGLRGRGWSGCENDPQRSFWDCWDVKLKDMKNGYDLGAFGCFFALSIGTHPGSGWVLSLLSNPKPGTSLSRGLPL